ncbi:hypothetical protein ACFFRR_000421 [Megaselia abdita]
MFFWRQTREALLKFIEHHSVILIYTSLFLFLSIGYLNYELKYNQKDLLFWTRELRELHREFESLLVVLITAILLAKIICLVFIATINFKPLKLFRELTTLDFRRNYADYIFLKLTTQITRIEEQLHRNGKIPSFEFYEARKEIETKIAEFKRDARRLVNPTEFEVILPSEEIFDCRDYEGVDKRFHNVHIEETRIKDMLSS